MTYNAKDSGDVWRVADEAAYVNISNTWHVIDTGYVNVSGVWRIFHKHLVSATASSGTNVSANTLFSVDDWTSTKPKQIIIPSGVSIGSLDPTVPAFTVPAGFGGELTIINEGGIFGASGQANSGVGGTALLAAQAITLINEGTIYAGGGGGGQGGTGGGGYYNTTQNEGPLYSPPNYMVSGSYNQYKGFYWGSYLGQAAGNPASLSSGGWTYYQGSTQSGDSYHQISRSRTVTNYTSGGSGGNGGQGQGYNQSLTNGSDGSAGGTNAGTGGTGGSGGSWGTNGNDGATGSGGNHTGGVSGSTGGLSGAALQDAANITLTNNGSILGRQI